MSKVKKNGCKKMTDYDDGNYEELSDKRILLLCNSSTMEKILMKRELQKYW